MYYVCFHLKNVSREAKKLAQNDIKEGFRFKARYTWDQTCVLKHQANFHKMRSRDVLSKYPIL